MVSIVGTKTSILGFGLCGFDDVHEVGETASVEEIKEAISKCDDVVLIDEQLTHDIALEKYDKTFVVIPWRFKEEEGDGELDAIIQEALGVSID